MTVLLFVQHSNRNNGRFYRAMSDFKEEGHVKVLKPVGNRKEIQGL